MGLTPNTKGKQSGSVLARNKQRERLNAVFYTVGMVTMFAGASSKVPPGWLLCEGGEVLKTAYPSLYDLLGTTYGTPTDTDYFSLPDFRDRVPIGPSGFVAALGGTYSEDSTAGSDFDFIGLYFIIRAY